MEKIDNLESSEYKRENFSFEDMGLKGEWKFIENTESGGFVELESFDSEKEKLQTRVLFIPGMPGDSVNWMKNRFLGDLLETGYDVDLLRHAGLKVSDENKDYVANQSRLEKGGVIGKENARLKDWFTEIELLLRKIQEGDNDYIVVSHSLGSLATAVALLDKNNLFEDERIKKWINLSGATINEEKASDPDFIETLKNYVSDNVSPRYDFDPESSPAGDILEEVKHLSELLNKDSKLGDTRLISVYPKKDNLVDISSGENIHDNLDTGLLVDDDTVDDEEYKDVLENNPFAIHDYPHLKSETLVRLLKMKVNKIPHRVKFKK